MYWAKVAVVLLSPLCQGSPVEGEHAFEIGSLGKASIVRSVHEAAERVEVRPHLAAIDGSAALTEMDSGDAVAHDKKRADDAREAVCSLAREASASKRDSKSISRMVAERTNSSMTGIDKVDLGWAPCAWQKPTKDGTMHCADGTYCDPKTDQWTCCATHGGRLQCPKTLPFMCNQMNCGGNDYCCAGWCEYYDGDKPCSIKHKVYGVDDGWLTFLTRDADGEPIPEWTDLVTGPMTWEMWYSRRPQAEGNSKDGNAIMATYGDNHNTNAFDTHNRRRNIGVYIQPDTGHLSLATFTGPRAKLTPDADDQWGGADSMLGPAILDNDWHHIAVVWNKTQGKGWLFLDGQKHSKPVRYEPGDENPGLDGKLVIGGGHLGRKMTGQISQVRIWKVGMHEAQMQQIMGCGEPDLPAADLKAFYRLSGDLDNSVTSGFLPLQWQGEQGVFAEGNPCVKGKAGLKGKDQREGPPGAAGLLGIDGDAGEDSTVVGAKGPPGRAGPPGPPGAPPQFAAMGAASMKDLYLIGGICSGVTFLAFTCIYLTYVRGGKSTEAAAPAEESWDQGY